MTETTATGEWQGDSWVEKDGYTVNKKFVEKYPDLYGPAAIDPDEGNGEIELNDAVAQFMNKYTGAGGTFSTWSERHCFITALTIGNEDVKSSDDIPPVPHFWITEAHYWRTGIFSGRLIEKKNLAEAANLALETLPGLLQNKEIMKRIGVLFAGAAGAGYVLLPTVISFLQKLTGIGG